MQKSPELSSLIEEACTMVTLQLCDGLQMRNPYTSGKQLEWGH